MSVTHCPDDGALLVKPSFGQHLECPTGKHSSEYGNRRCARCGGPDGSWMSGLCSGCYTRFSRESDEAQREEKKRSTERWLLEDLRRAIVAADAPPAIRIVDEWIEARS